MGAVSVLEVLRLHNVSRRTNQQRMLETIGYGRSQRSRSVFPFAHYAHLILFDGQPAVLRRVGEYFSR